MVAFNIYQPGKAVNDKPFLLDMDIRKILVGDFPYGGTKEAKKRAVILMATDTGLYEVNLNSKNMMDLSAIDIKLIDQDRDGNKVSYQGADHLIQKGDNGDAVFSSNNKLYRVLVE